APYRHLPSFPTRRSSDLNTVKIFLGILGAKAKQPVTSLTPKHIEDFLNQRLTAGMAPKTTIVDLKTLGTAFRRAESYGIILKNPDRKSTRLNSSHVSISY